MFGIDVALVELAAVIALCGVVPAAMALAGERRRAASGAAARASTTAWARSRRIVLGGHERDRADAVLSEMVRAAGRRGAAFSDGDGLANSAPAYAAVPIRCEQNTNRSPSADLDRRRSA